MIYLMYGLPGCGKSFTARKIFEELSIEASRSPIGDKIIYLFSEDGNVQNHTDYGNTSYKKDDIIVDYFCKTTEELYNKLAEIVQERFWSPDQDVIVFEFKQNKDACHINDRKRGRAELATATIENGIEYFDIRKFVSLCKNNPRLSKCTNVCINKVGVVHVDEKISSDTLYSAWRYGSEIDDGFTELDNYLEKYYPTITFLQYKKLIKLVETDEDFSRDYYDEEPVRSVRWSIPMKYIYEVCK